MVDFKKLRTKSTKEKSPAPTEIFRRLPKPTGINDLYTSQTEVLKAWYSRRKDRDIVLKLHTGGGKTLVGLLMAQSTIEETGEPVLYLTPTVQLVNQTLEKAKAMGIAAVPYHKGQDLSEDFVNGKAVMVATYNALFNGRSKFRLRGSGTPQTVGAVILDDAHVAFSVIRDSFTLEVKRSENEGRYKELGSLFRQAFKEVDHLGTFDDVLDGSEYSILEVPYWAWHEQIDTVRAILRSNADDYPFHWPLIRNELHLCHALVSRDSFAITPLVPPVSAFPTFADAPRRIYMSATISDDTDIIRTFDADPALVGKPLTSRSLAGVSERMLLMPDLMPFKFDVATTISELASWTAQQQKGAVILAPSDAAAAIWDEKAAVARGSQQVEQLVDDLQAGKLFGPAVFANRYDGMDLPGDSCRLLILINLPAGTSSYEIYLASALSGGATISKMLAQRIEQGIGRGARGAGDHCVVILAGADLAGWIAKAANFKLLTSATRAQLEMGIEVSKAVGSLEELRETINRSFLRDPEWTEYHAEMLADLVDEAKVSDSLFALAATERKAFNLWRDGHHESAISRIEGFLYANERVDDQAKGWLEQMAARIANHWGNFEKAERLQQNAYAHNLNLLRPKVRPPYRPLPVPNEQAVALARQFNEYHIRRGLLKNFEDTVAYLHDGASANQFESALAKLGSFIGLSAERCDNNGKGPDVLWLMPGNQAFVIEAKSRKKEKSRLTKTDHGQLLVAAEWFREQYPNYSCLRVSVHPRNVATAAASASSAYALTYEKLTRLVSDARALLISLAESQLVETEFLNQCSHLLNQSNIHAAKIASTYLVPFLEDE